ncbi:MAG: hypothetical protein Q8L14_05300 [Myxococcales bacterium]|nr:hypothetical protein [Myxococcales bacterium]
MQLDAGQQLDAGVAAPVAFCLSSECEVDGTWQVSFTRDSGYYGIPACSPTTAAPLRLTSDGGSVCMIGADEGSSDGGRRFLFHVSRTGFDWAGSEVWAVDEARDGGALVGTWTVSMAFPSCSDSYSIRATR